MKLKCIRGFLPPPCRLVSEWGSPLLCQVSSIRVMSRKRVIYTWAGQTQGKPCRKTAPILTCKSFVKPGYRGERPIELSSSWFRPKGPSGSLSLFIQFCPLERMMRGVGGFAPRTIVKLRIGKAFTRLLYRRVCTMVGVRGLLLVSSTGAEE